MGMDYCGAVIVGLPRSEIVDQILIENGDIEVCAPYYDGNGEDTAIAGLYFAQTSAYQARELIWDQTKIEELKKQFRALTGQDGKVYLSPQGY